MHSFGAFEHVPKQGPGFKSTNHQIKRGGDKSTILTIIFHYRKQHGVKFGFLRGKEMSIILML